jgi:hypothetical protein
MQVTSFKTQAEFNEAMRLAHLNDNPFGILSNIYDDEHPHPYFDPDKIGFYRYRNYNHQQYTSRKELPNKSIVFEDFEMYIPGIGDLDHTLIYDVEQCPLTECDYVITSCITKNDHMWPVPYVYNNYHFVRTHEVNKEQVFNSPTTRPYLADVLLGNPKSHRNTFFKLLRANNMLDDCIINLFGIYKSKFLEEVDDNIQNIIDSAEQKGGYVNTTNLIDGNFVSQYISMPIMDASWYSVVGETISNNDCFFVTEKTAKPMMAGRPFIMLSGKHTLKHLRDIGFKTFNPVIDESYDLIDDEYERISAAFDSFQKLCTQDPKDVYNKLHPVLEHNRKIMLDKSILTQHARTFLDNIQLDLV